MGEEGRTGEEILDKEVSQGKAPETSMPLDSPEVSGPV